MTVETWIKRFLRYCPINTIEIEQVRFDTQSLQHPEIKGTKYQQGTLAGTEVREYLRHNPPLSQWAVSVIAIAAGDRLHDSKEIQQIVRVVISVGKSGKSSLSLLFFIQ